MTATAVATIMIAGTNACFDGPHATRDRGVRLVTWTAPAGTYDSRVPERWMTRIVGRDAECEIARNLVHDLRLGSGATLLVEGEAGIGKSRFVDAVVADARELGLVVVRGAAHPFERARPFGAIAAALDLVRRSSDRRRAAIGQLLAGDTDAASVAPGTVPDLRHRIVEDIVDLIETSCVHGPMVVVLEDLHWADNSTLLAARSLVRRLAGFPFMLVATLRPSPRGPDLEQFIDDASQFGAIVVRLGPLSADAIAALALDQLRGTPGPALNDTIAKASGNPLLVVELLRSLDAEQLLLRVNGIVETTSLELPGSLRDVVLRRLRHLSPSALDLLRLAAVLGDAVLIRDLVAVARRPPHDVVDQLLEAFEAGLLDERGDTIVFRHQLVHDAVYQAVPGPARQLLHRAAAEALATSGADLRQIADQLVLGATRGDLEAVDWLRRAAHEAGARDPSAAVELLARAESLLPGGHADADLVSSELVDALLRAGKAAEAAARARAVLDRRHRPDIDSRLRLGLLSALSLQNRPWELIERTEATLALADGLSVADQALVLAQESLGRTFSGDMIGGERAARRALERAEGCGDLAMTVWSLTTLSVPLSRQGRYAEALEHARRAVRLTATTADPAAQQRHPRFFLGMALCDADLIDEAEREYEAALAEYDALGSTWLLADTLLMSTTGRFLTGNWDDALAEFESGLIVAAEQGLEILTAQSNAYRAMIHTARGDHHAAHLALAPFRRELTNDSPSFGAQSVAIAAALLAEAEGDTEGAFAMLRRVWINDVANEIRFYHRSIGPTLVRLGLELGHDAVAGEVVDVVEAGAALAPEIVTVRSAARRCRGWLESSPDLMVEAVELARQGPRRLEQAASCEDAAQILVANDRASDARAFLTEAIEIYETMEATAWEARTAAALRRLGVRRGARGSRQRAHHGWDSLTATERSVSELVAEGLTNRDVARRLHMSPHTVNTHLRHVFAKLAVINRVSLSAEVTRQSRSSRSDAHSFE
jgi:DNA-binding CsgD family transcriptional regulator